MIGAVAGDIIGSVYEFDNHRSVDFPLFTESSTFTDDSVLTFATAAVLLGKGEYAAAYQDFARRYRGRGYGGNFYRWIYTDDPRPYNSYGNGSAMRVSPVGFAFDSLEETLAEAQRSAEVTHNHPEGIKGAQATAQVIFMSRKGASKAEIKREINQRLGMTFRVPWNIFAKSTNSTRPARVRSPKPSAFSWLGKIMSTPSAWRFQSAGIPIRLPALPAGWRRLFTAASRLGLCAKSARAFRPNSSKSWMIFRIGFRPRPLYCTKIGASAIKLGGAHTG